GAVDAVLVARAPQQASRPDAAALRADIEKTYQEQILADDGFDEKPQQWAALIAQAERYLALPESFDGGDFGPMRRIATPDPDVAFVTIQAPSPYLAGTLSQNWNYLQTRKDGTVHLQRLGEKDPKHFRDARFWKDGDASMMTVLTVAKLASNAYVPAVSVRRLDGDDWVPASDRFVTNTATLEGHDLFLGADGSLCLDEAYTGGPFISMAFDGDSPNVVLRGGADEHPLPLVSGRYVLQVKTEAEKAQEARDAEVARITESFGRIAGEPAITRSENEVNINGVKLPVRRVGGEGG
ncbi:MAG: hypothetical protein EB084_25170, partial [Proteobacteria bacterium]|nr:hypothetical protein [Pseudomonadota bacterium]